jgi:hypothetical protein
MEPLTVWLMDEPECEAYERFAAEHPAAGLYHSLAWRDARRFGDGGTPSYLAALRGERVVGVLPLVEECDLWGRRRLVSLPDTPACGPAAEDAQVEAALFDKAASYAQSRGAAALAIRRFVRRSERPGAETAGGWLRVAARTLATIADSEQANIELTPVPDDSAYRLDARTTATMDHLRRAGIETGAAATRGGDSLIAWARLGFGLHVLHIDDIGNALAASAALLRQAPQQRGTAIRWVDLPPVRGRGALPRSLITAAQVVVEEQIPVPRSATLLSRAARSLSFALTG